jgi:DNA-binding transcriptional ArsR family regulator
MAEKESPESESAAAVDAEYMTSAKLKAYAHPLRRQLMRVLAREGYGRAADLARLVGKPANQVSFHLRALSEIGWLEEAPELARDGRDRVWRLVPSALNVGSPEHPAEDRDASLAVLTVFAAEQHELLDRVSAWSAKYVTGEDPELRGMAMAGTVRVTREEFRELSERVQEAIHHFAERRPAGMRIEPGGDVHVYDFAFLAADETI